MKRKNTKNTLTHLKYLYELALKLPYKSLAHSKCADFLDLSNKMQCRLGKAKQTLCLKCKLVLVPKVNCSTEFVRRENGFGLWKKCMNCGGSSFIVKRGY